MVGAETSNMLLYILLLAALALGWWLGRKSYSGSDGTGKKKKRFAHDRDYFVGLNYLLNDEPDDAIDIFIESLDINSGTLDTYMALGTLLRRRGKVDRSIAVYQDLLGKSGFTKGEYSEIKLNLVQSYIAAGLLDRAEHLLAELRLEKGLVKIRALKLSANVYQREKDWLEGVSALTELLKFCPSPERGRYQNLASHFYCELAEEEIVNEHLSRARECLRQASAMDKHNSRVSMLSGNLEMLMGNYKEAIKNYLRVKKQDPDFLADVFNPLVECYEKTGKKDELQKFIDNTKAEETDTSVLIALAHYLERERGQEQARQYLLGKLAQNPSLRLLMQSIALDAAASEAQNEHKLFLQVLKENLENKAQYQCYNCGFELKNLLWHCPSCLRWGMVKHVRGMLG